jgi:hypothetical protein
LKLTWSRQVYIVDRHEFDEEPSERSLMHTYSREW